MANRRPPRRNLKAAVARPRNENERALADAVQKLNARFSQITFPEIEKLNELAAAVAQGPVGLTETMALFSGRMRDIKTTADSMVDRMFGDVETRARTRDIVDSLLAKHATRCGVKADDHRALALALVIDVERRNRKHAGPVTLATLQDWLRGPGRPRTK